jgi:hypothetical protein
MKQGLTISCRDVCWLLLRSICLSCGMKAKTQNQSSNAFWSYPRVTLCFHKQKQKWNNLEVSRKLEWPQMKLVLLVSQHRAKELYKVINNLNYREESNWELKKRINFHMKCLNWVVLLNLIRKLSWLSGSLSNFRS